MGGGFRSSTNEGSKSVNTFGQFKNFKFNSRSSNPGSPNSIRSILSSNLGNESGSYRFGISVDKNSEKEYQNSTRSLMAQSLNHSFGSYYRDQRMASDRRSLFTMPLIEFDTLGQNKKHNSNFSSKQLSDVISPSESPHYLSYEQ